MCIMVVIICLQTNIYYRKLYSCLGLCPCLLGLYITMGESLKTKMIFPLDFVVIKQYLL